MGNNVYGVWGSKSGTIGGNRYVIATASPIAKLPVGAVISNPFNLGGVAFEGDVLEYNFSAKTAKLLKVFKVAKAVTASDTEIWVEATDFSHVLQAGINVMKAPTALAGTDVAVAVGAVTKAYDATAGYVYKFAITANALGTLAKGDLLVEAEAAGSGKKMYVQNPNAILEADIYFNETPAVGGSDYEGARYPVSLLHMATIYGKKATPMPTAVKENLRKGFTDILVIE